MRTILVCLFIVPLALSARAEKDYSSFDSAASPETKSRFAMLDDVRILANGLLQLGHGLKDFVHKTKGQMNDIFQKLYIFDRSFYELSQQTSEIKEEEEQLRQTTARLQINNEEIKNLSQEMNSKIEDLIQNKIQLQEKVWGLEDKVTKLATIQPSAQETKEISSLKLNHIELQELAENSFTEELTEPEAISFPVHNTTAVTKKSDGGWWHSECEETNLNGKYVAPRSRGRLDRRKGLYWKPKKGRYYLLKSTKIMIHPTDLKSFD
ncbi:angiopoietin-related protein 3 [Limosa lapponica baueri]|uniref:Angiopoietin-related protein 3 n=1 Tax=Limosa lapponica baueri TaxID=1758121 RepID=A0A2I0TIZ8_LIMLA|nr:angiopoietin-related protein 3 [Limosa lapponica baueri]